MGTADKKEKSEIHSGICTQPSNNKKVMKTMKASADRISALPDEIIIHHILPYMSVDQAISTSILSKRWRYLWTFSPNLFFPPYCDGVVPYEDFLGMLSSCPNSCPNSRPYGKCNGAAIDACIRQYQAKQLQRLCIRIFEEKKDDSSARIQGWFDFSRDRKVEILSVVAPVGIKGDRFMWFRVPDSLFSLHSLQSLSMSYCQLYPSSFDIKSFGSLKCLSLQWLQDFDGALQSLLSKCHNLETLQITLWPKLSESQKLSISLPLLQHLTIEYASRYSLIEVDAPKLRFLNVVDHCIFNLHIKNAPSLQMAHLSFRNGFPRRSPRDHLQVLCQHFHVWGSTLHNISNIKKLSLRHDALKDLSKLINRECSINRKRKVVFTNLKEFFLYGLYTTDALYHLVKFFGGCPSLEQVTLSYRRNKEPFPSTIQREEHPIDEDGRLTSDSPDYVIDHLKRVSMVGFTGAAKQILLLDFFLKRATNVDKLMLEHYETVHGDHLECLHKYIFLLSKISPNAKICLSRYRDVGVEAEIRVDLYESISRYILSQS